MARVDHARAAFTVRCAIYTRKSSDEGLEAGIQLSRRPAGGVRGLYREPASCRMDHPLSCTSLKQPVRSEPQPEADNECVAYPPRRASRLKRPAPKATICKRPPAIAKFLKKFRNCI